MALLALTIAEINDHLNGALLTLRVAAFFSRSAPVAAAVWLLSFFFRPTAFFLPALRFLAASKLASFATCVGKAHLLKILPLVYEKQVFPLDKVC